MSERKKIAAIVTAYFPFSHADVIVSKFLKGFPADGGLHQPEVEIVSMYLDQLHEKDVGMELARECGVEIYFSIAKALCLGGKELAVDGVLIIGEHGDYAWNERKNSTCIHDAISSSRFAAYSLLRAVRYRCLAINTCRGVGSKPSGCMIDQKSWM